MIRNDLPYAPPVNGRWYRFFLENDNGKIKKTYNDLPYEVNQYEKTFYVFINEEYRMIDYIIDGVLEKTGVCDIRLQYSNGKTGLTFTNIDAIDTITIYAYCVRN